MDGQEGCLLFKLPLEIRRQIYEEVLGDCKIFIGFCGDERGRSYRKVTHTFFQHKDLAMCVQLRRLQELFNERDERREILNTNFRVGLLGLVKCCW